MGIDSERCSHVSMAHLLLQYCDGNRTLCQFGRKAVPETVQSGILLRNFQPSQDRLETVLHNVVAPTGMRALAVCEEPTRWVGDPVVFEVIPKCRFQRGRHRKDRNGILGLGLTD